MAVKPGEYLNILTAQVRTQFHWVKGCAYWWELILHPFSGKVKGERGAVLNQLWVVCGFSSVHKIVRDHNGSEHLCKFES